MIVVDAPAPAFSADTDEGRRSLLDYSGKRLLLYFYPKDNTPGCTTQALQFRDCFPQFVSAGVEILGVSRDSLESHRKFRAKYELPFPLLSDGDGSICEAFGVWKEKSMCGKKYMGIERSTFLIDEGGLLRAEWRKVKVGGHAEAVLKKIRAVNTR